MKKQEMLDFVENLPDEFDPERVMDELYLKLKLDRAEEAVERGEVVAHEDVVKRSQEWFK